MKSGSDFMRMLHKPSHVLEMAQTDLVGDFLWSNFWNDMTVTAPVSIEHLMRPALMTLIHAQGSSITQEPPQLISYMSDDQITGLATHLYVAAKLTPELRGMFESATPNEGEYAFSFQESSLHHKAFMLCNPFILRCHVFALRERMLDLVNNKENYGKDYRHRCSATRIELKNSIDKISEMLMLYPTFSHFLLAHCYYALSLMGETQSKKQNLMKAYASLLLCEQLKDTAPRIQYILTLGQGLFNDMPADTVEAFKALIESQLTPDEIASILR